MYRVRYSNDERYSKIIGKANKHVSVRLPESIYNVIDSYEGKNFSDKLINYIFDCEYNKTR